MTVAEQILTRVFPSGIPPDQLSIAVRITQAVSEVIGAAAPALEVPAPAPTNGNGNGRAPKPIRPPVAPAVAAPEDPLIVLLRKGATVEDITRELHTSKQAVRVRLARLEKKLGSKLSRELLAPERGAVGRPATFYRLAE